MSAPDAPSTCPCGAVCVADEECERCQHFRCSTCKLWCPWGEGNEDPEGWCNKCWYAAEAAGKGA